MNLVVYSKITSCRRSYLFCFWCIFFFELCVRVCFCRLHGAGAKEYRPLVVAWLFGCPALICLRLVWHVAWSWSLALGTKFIYVYFLYVLCIHNPHYGLFLHVTWHLILGCWIWCAMLLWSLPWWFVLALGALDFGVELCVILGVWLNIWLECWTWRFDLRAKYFYFIHLLYIFNIYLTYIYVYLFLSTSLFFFKF